MLSQPGCAGNGSRNPTFARAGAVAGGWTSSPSILVSAVLASRMAPLLKIVAEGYSMWVRGNSSGQRALFVWRRTRGNGYLLPQHLAHLFILVPPAVWVVLTIEDTLRASREACSTLYPFGGIVSEILISRVLYWYITFTFLYRDESCSSIGASSVRPSTVVVGGIGSPVTIFCESVGIVSWQELCVRGSFSC